MPNTRHTQWRLIEIQARGFWLCLGLFEIFDLVVLGAGTLTGMYLEPACQVWDIWSYRLRPSYAIWRLLKVARSKLTFLCQHRQDFPNIHFSANSSDQCCFMQAVVRSVTVGQICDG